MERDDILLVLEDDLGSIVMSQHITPGIIYVAAKTGDEAFPSEYYIAERDCTELSQEAKRYGRPLEHHPEYLCYPAGSPDNGRMVIEYEANRYLKKHGLPLMECESLLALADYGREYEPEYFGDYPAPLYTPKGLTLRYVSLKPGIFLIETDKLDKVLAVCYPIWNSEISDYTKSRGEQFTYDQLCGIDNTEGYLFFTEENACLALFELWPLSQLLEKSQRINTAAMMNAIWKYHPTYAASHNIREQAGLNDGLALLAISLGIDVDLQGSTDNVIPLFEGVGTDYLNI